jgi:hypothetical protein
VLLAALLGSITAARMEALPAEPELTTPPLPRLTARRLPTDGELAELEGRLNHTFNNKWLLKTALIHPSYGELNNARCLMAAVPARLPTLLCRQPRLPCLVLAKSFTISHGSGGCW